MTQPINRETAITLAKEVGFKASVGQTVDDTYHPDRNAIGKSVPVEWVQRFYDLAVAHSRKDAEPVAYQYRMKPEWHDAWVKWQPCDKANFDDYVKAPVVNGWQFEARALFTHPPEADKLLQQALAECERLKKINSDLCRVHNGHLVEAARLELECERLRADAERMDFVLDNVGAKA